MDTNALLEGLGYADSPNCLRGADLEHAGDHGHVFRRAREGAGLEAVYCLRTPPSAAAESTSIIPVTYVCRAASPDEANRIHRLVWNQDVAPFVVVLAPDGVRLYAGFEHEARSQRPQWLEHAPLREATRRLSDLSASSIDSGQVWDKLGRRARPQNRVQWRLLQNLRQLEEGLGAWGLDAKTVHALIGKFLYLHYLRQREILSDARLDKWGLSWTAVAGRKAKVNAFVRVCAELEGWLNGSVFPLSERAIRRLGSTVIQHIGGVFAGDEAGGQLHLDFQAYDFSYVPIETLSVVYEQFLHLRKTSSGGNAGREQGAYYTPIPLVNFIIDRMEETRALEPGMRVLDPACGSGAFLVQCYRRLVERHIRANPHPRPPELRELLTRHVFGIDVDGDACRIAELSLILTLLGYVDPPDLTNTSFKLPALSGSNIVEGNAFDNCSDLVTKAKAGGFDWIVGNPPWKDLGKKAANRGDAAVLRWIEANKAEKPTGGNQSAEAFAWRSQELARPGALIGLLMPAMTLFKHESTAFRRWFFAQNPPAYVANLANLAEVLFAGRSRVPAAALIVSCDDREEVQRGRIPVFSPLVANQESTRPRTTGARVDTWSIVIDEAEVRNLDRHDIRSGDALAWKIAAWGSTLDRSILRRSAEAPSLSSLEESPTGLTISEGMKLRGRPKPGSAALEAHERELAAKLTVDVKALRGARRIFAFPPSAMVTIPRARTWVETGRFVLREKVSRPPHIVVNAARNWAVYSEQYLVVPSRQIGIAGTPAQAGVLKAIALYLNSDFVQYHQFFLSTQAGVKREVSTLAALRKLPVPESLADPNGPNVRPWAKLHDQLAALDRAAGNDGGKRDKEKARLLDLLNEKVSAALGLHETERCRIRDFVNVILGLRDGKVEERAVRAPTNDECNVYATRLKGELDAFVGLDRRHAIDVWHDGSQGIVQVALRPRDARVSIHSGDSTSAVLEQAKELREQIQARFSQWRYFNRALRLFAGNRIFLFKPMQRFHWLESQAILDAGEVIGVALDDRQ